MQEDKEATELNLNEVLPEKNKKRPRPEEAALEKEEGKKEIND